MEEEEPEDADWVKVEAFGGNRRVWFAPLPPLMDRGVDWVVPK